MVLTKLFTHLPFYLKPALGDFRKFVSMKPLSFLPGEENLPCDSMQTSALSRRGWLERISLPALGLMGASFAGFKAAASSTEESGADKNGNGTKQYNVRDYGARGDGKTLDTIAIQSAIDACFRDKGGTVLVPAGVFICGTIELHSNITLHLAPRGKLLGSPHRKDYSAGKGVPPGNGNIVFIYAVNAENISIEGKGTIDGNGAAFYTGKGDNTGPGQKGIGGNFDRPHLAIFYQCSRLSLVDTFFTASAYHCFRILQCREVRIDGVRIYNRVNKNNDGFHFNSSQYVHLSNSDVQCQDDACALFGSNKFVTVSNCSFSTRWSVFRFGGGESQNIAVSNCLIYETYGCPIKISAGRAQIENLSFSNIIMRNVTGPIGIGFSGGDSGNSSPEGGKPFVRNISFSNIRATVVAQPINHPDIPFDVNVFEGEKNSCITLNAMGDHYLENISFSDVHITYAGGGTAEQAAKRNIPAVAAEYFGVWNSAPPGPPSYGLYARNVKGLTLQHVRFEYQSPEARPSMVLDNVKDCLVNGFSAMGNPETELVRLTGCSDVYFSAARLLSAAASFLQLEGSGNEGIMIDGGDQRKAVRPVMYEGGASEKSVLLRK